MLCILGLIFVAFVPVLKPNIQTLIFLIFFYFFPLENVFCPVFAGVILHCVREVAALEREGSGGCGASPQPPQWGWSGRAELRGILGALGQQLRNGFC